MLGLDKAGNTPFHWACYSGDVECVKLLLPQSISIINQKVRQWLFVEMNLNSTIWFDFDWSKNNVGDTPLHVASWKNHADIVQLLLENGADKGIRNKDNKIASNLAHDPTVRSLLEDKGLFDQSWLQILEYLSDFFNLQLYFPTIDNVNQNKKAMTMILIKRTRIYHLVEMTTLFI